MKFFLTRGLPKAYGVAFGALKSAKMKQSTIKKTIKAHNKNAKIIRRLDSFKHSFTHYNLWISPVLIESPGGSNNYFETGLNAQGCSYACKKNNPSPLINQKKIIPTVK